MLAMASSPPSPPETPPEFVPNVRPAGIEVAGDRKWREWRLRKRRPGLRHRFTATFPDISSAWEKRALGLIHKESVVRTVRFQKRSIADLGKDPTVVEQLQFRPLQAVRDKVDLICAATRPRRPQALDEFDTLPAFFFEDIASSLFARVWDFAAETFGQQPAQEEEPGFSARLVASCDWTSLLLEDLSDDWVRIVSEVARADPNMKQEGDDDSGYEFLFVDRESRVALCTAVIAKLLQENCLDSLLFGARKIERETLQKIDESQEDVADGTWPS